MHCHHGYNRSSEFTYAGVSSMVPDSVLCNSDFRRCVGQIIQEQDSRNPMRAGVALSCLGLAVTSLYVMVALSHQGNPTSTATWEWGWLVPHASWLFLTATVLVVTVVNQRALRKSMWAGQATLHRAKTADISAEGLCITDAVSRLEYRWQAFAGWQETKSLFVIFLSQYQVIFLPKHAFESAEMLDAMRALASLIPASVSSAFQVVQPNAIPPLPADPHA